MLSSNLLCSQNICFLSLSGLSKYKTPHPFSLSSLNLKNIHQDLFLYFILLLFVSQSLLNFSICLPYNSRSTWKISKIWDDFWSDLALWDVDFGGSCLNTKPSFSSAPPPPIEKTNRLIKREKERKKKKNALFSVFNSSCHLLIYQFLIFLRIVSLVLHAELCQWEWPQSQSFMYWLLMTAQQIGS